MSYDIDVIMNDNELIQKVRLNKVNGQRTVNIPIGSPLYKEDYVRLSKLEIKED